MLRILFVCTGNTCRSPIAQALLKKMWDEQSIDSELKVLSAGIFTSDGLPASPEAIEVMLKENIDITDHKSLQINEQLIKDADLIFTMTEFHRRSIIDEFPEYESSVFTITEYINLEGDIVDPFGRGVEAYYETVEQLKGITTELVKKLNEDIERNI
ncbi:MAG TPA: low molecular weight protein arginine phosphatase [Syntrophomonadaceae bacterium]|nr:low molecular weight protein arginine phosphatase [Syntrophomonadaceae bacterium]